MTPLSFSDRYWFVRLTIGIIALAAVVVGALFLIKGCAEEPHTHTESEKWIISKAAGCTTEGEQYKVCTGCGVQLRYETIPSKHSSFEKSINAGKTPNGVTKKQKTVEATCLTAGSITNIYRCKECNEILHTDEPKPIDIIDPRSDIDEYYTKAVEVSGSRVEPTCTKPGYYKTVRTCELCKYLKDKCANYQIIEEIPIPAKGHDYEWTTFFNETTHIANLKGVCKIDCNEENESFVFTPDNSGLVVTRDESYAVCCKWYYTLTMTYAGKKVEEEYTHPVDAHKVVSYNSTLADGTIKTAYIPISDYLCESPYVDLKTGKELDCYDYNGTDRNGNNKLSIFVKYNADAGWDENGYCEGFFVCQACKDANCADEGHNGVPYVIIMLYNSEYDQRLNNSN